MKILEIGCGPAVHSEQLSKILIGWRENWTGIDLSPEAVAYARNSGLDATVEDILTFDRDAGTYELFLFLDSLEHIENLKALATRIKYLAAPQFRIFGNVPLYPSAHDDGVEYPMSTQIVAQFLVDCGCGKMPLREVYGIKGYPYLVFEGANA